MKTVTITDIKTKGNKVIDKNEPTYLIVNSKIQTVLVPLDQYEAFLEMQEDQEDLKFYKERKTSKRESWDDVMNELGIKDEDLQD